MDKAGEVVAASTSPMQAERSPRGKPRGKRRSEEKKHSCRLRVVVAVA